MHYYYYWFFPSKKVRHGRRCWRPLDYLTEHFNELDSIEAASSISTVTDSSSGTDTDSSSEEEAWFAPRLDLKSSASASAVRRENIMLRRIIRRQDEILEEMRLRTIQIQEATAQ